MDPARAMAVIGQHCVVVPDAECDLEQAVGRVLRAPLLADRDSPPYDRVMMDGYAVRLAGGYATGSAGAGRRYRVRGVAAAGHPPSPLGGPDEAVEAMTGAVLPAGADAVVPVEWCRLEGDEVVVTPPLDAPPPAPGLYVHARGAGGRRGRVVVAAGTRLGAAEVAVAASEGVRAVRASPPLRVRLVTTGDEVVSPDTDPLPWQIRGSHAAGLQALLSGHGPVDWRHGHARDRQEELAATLGTALRDADLLLVAGGVSRGRFDLVPGVLQSLGVRELFHRVAQRPGKPLWFGVRGDVPVFGLPGNPLAVLVCARRYVVPAMELRLGATPRAPLILATRGRGAGLAGLTLYLPVRLEADAAVLMPAANSGDLHALVGSDGFVEIPPTDRAAAPAPAQPPGPSAFYAWSR